MLNILFGKTARTPLRQRLLTLALMAFLSLAGLAASAPAAMAQGTGSPDLVISQVYTRGGEAGAAFRNDFIEVFNRGSENIALEDYSIYFETTITGTPTPLLMSFVSSGAATIIAPGTYRLIQLGSGGNQGAFLPVTPDSGAFLPPDFPHLNAASGRVAIVRHRNFTSLGCPAGQDPSVVDLVGYGVAVACAEGAAPVAAPASNASVKRKGEGCTDTDNNAADFDLAAPPVPRNSGSAANVCAPSSATDTFQFEQAVINLSESATGAFINVIRSGNTTAPASVNYATVDSRATSTSGSASDRQDYSTAIGTLRFAPGETRKDFRLLINDDTRSEDQESITILLGNPTGGVALGAQRTMTINMTSDEPPPSQTNLIDLTNFFVRRQYADFLNREPDAEGLAFWSNNIDSCGADTQCVQVKRVDTSAAFFLSIEFQETGYLAYRLFKAAFPNSLSRPRGFPTYREFVRDTQEAGRGVIVGVGNWEQQLAANKSLLVDEFILRPEFRLRYPASQTPAQYVDALNQNAGSPLSQSERDALVDALTMGTETRATALRRVAEDEDFRRAELNRAFVLMQYFGYLRRAPNDSPDFNFDGYDFWLSKLDQFGGDFRRAEMVKAFLSSVEYRARFAAPAP